MEAEANPGEVIGGRYRLEAVIGAGAYGRVWRALDQAMGRGVAVKVVATHYDDYQERFLREASVAQKLTHPHTVRILDFGRTAKGFPFLVLELLEGETLEARIEREGKLELRTALTIARQVLSALTEAHEKGIVHRDLKPANIFLARHSGEPVYAKVLDFGLAKDANQKALTRAGEVLGTPSYMAPEQILGRAVDGRSDLYSVGLILAEMISGRMVYGSGTLSSLLIAQASASPPPLPAEITSHVAGPIVIKATHKEPAARYSDAHDMLVAVDRAMANASGPAPQRTQLGQVAPTRAGVTQVFASTMAAKRTHPVMIVAAAAFAMLALIVSVALVIKLARGGGKDGRADRDRDSDSEEDARKDQGPSDKELRSMNWDRRTPRAQSAEGLAKALERAGYETSVENTVAQGVTVLSSITATKGECLGTVGVYQLPDPAGRQHAIKSWRGNTEGRVLEHGDLVLYIFAGSTATKGPSQACTDRLTYALTR